MTYGQTKRLFVYDWRIAGPAESFAPLAPQPYSLFLDSAREGHPLARYSYICWHPFETIEACGNRVTVTNPDHQFTYAADIFRVIRERISLWGDELKHKKGLPPFVGGAAGYFGYDLARTIEKLPFKKGSGKTPDLCIGLYNKVLAFDHQAGTAQLMIWAEDEARALTHKKYLEDLVTESPAIPVAEPSFPVQWNADKDDKRFEKDIARVIEYIYAGDIFQANLARRYSAALPLSFDPYAHYRSLRDVNAAPYGAYMNFGSVVLASCSPERFLEVKDRVIETRPIKGTLPSSRPASELADSEKDRAENIMIVDLLRNDLSKTCEDHSIEITKLCDIETFEGLHHMVSTVRGRLRGDQSALDALRACFPGGSITGAPKIRAMEIIHELEESSRGPYCGTIGWIGFNGDMDTAITIRTIVYEGGRATLHAGAGITALSDPVAEVREMALKAEKILGSFRTTEFTEEEKSEQRHVA